MKINLNELSFQELGLLLKIVEFYQMEQSFNPDEEHWTEVGCLHKKLEIAFID